VRVGIAADVESLVCAGHRLAPAAEALVSLVEVDKASYLGAEQPDPGRIKADSV
jgi:hypothetical protein